MPARTLQGTITDRPADLRTALLRIAGMFDDPVAMVRVTLDPTSAESTWTPGTPYQRRVRLDVVDRLDARYEPEGFVRTNGTNRGRWVVSVYFAETEFGAADPPSAGPAVVTGTFLGSLADGTGPVYFFLTDMTGRVEFDVTFLPEKGRWFHTGVPVLLRSRGVTSWGDGIITPGRGTPS